MSPQEERVLRALSSRGALTRAALKADADTIRRLLEDHLLEETLPSRKGASPRLAITEAGKRALLPAVSVAAPTLADVLREVAALREDLTTLRTVVDTIATVVGAERISTSTPTVARPSAALHAFSASVREAWHQLATKGGYGTLVPLPRLRESLSHLGMPRDAFDDAMLALEEEYLLDLKVANDPSRLADRDAGIETQDRGLLYFVVLR
jgi:hypothetical protein